MTSQLNVDTIVDKAGSGGSNVKIANTSVTVAEGGSATTNTVQGLCKFFTNIDGDAGSISTRDSFNQSGITDNGTGDFSFAFSNNMNNDDYAHMTNADSGTSHLALQYDESNQTTSGCRCYVVENNHTAGPTDSNVVMGTVNGDLA